MMLKAKNWYLELSESIVWSRILAISVVVVILAGSSVPSKKIPGIFSLTPDKLIHCLEYAVLGFFLFHWLRLEYARHTLFRISLTTLLLGSFMGIIDENYQRLTPGRRSDFWDWVLDTIGTLLAVLVMYYLASRKIKKSNKKGSK